MHDPKATKFDRLKCVIPLWILIDVDYDFNITAKTPFQSSSEYITTANIATAEGMLDVRF